MGPERNVTGKDSLSQSYSKFPFFFFLLYWDIVFVKVRNGKWDEYIYWRVFCISYKILIVKSSFLKELYLSISYDHNILMSVTWFL